MSRRLPANVQRADLIQVGLIAVAQSAIGFLWDGDLATQEAEQAFVRYAQRRVKGAMLDELRQMDQLSRGQRRDVKVIQMARERWRKDHATEPSALEVSSMCGIAVDEIFRLEAAAHGANTRSLSESTDDERPLPALEPATDQDEVEARVDTAILLRRIEPFFAKLPPRERQLIDAHLGIGMTPIELAKSLNISPAGVSKMFASLCKRIARHQRHPGARAIDRPATRAGPAFEELVALREAALSRSNTKGGWAESVEDLLAGPGADRCDEPSGSFACVTADTRWG